LFNFTVAIRTMDITSRVFGDGVRGMHHRSSRV